MPSGEVPRVVGRGPARADDPAPRLLPCQQRPGETLRCGPLADPSLSRVQLRLLAVREGLEIRRCGRAPLIHDNRELDEVVVAPGEIVQVGRRLVLLVVCRPAVLPGSPERESHAFAAADVDGIVGESPACWALRAELAFVSARAGHVLIQGASGTGKELVACAIARQSGRAPLVARNAATFPEGLIDAELFGNAANYPNPGMPLRAGLVGEASGGVLFLDEIGELPERLQTHLLRVLDNGGEYQRLGESRTRLADLRLIGATHRTEAHLRHDLAARLVLRLSAAGLEDRPEDIPLLVRHLLREIASKDAGMAQRLFPDNDLGGWPAIDPQFVVGLLQHHWTTHVRELERILWQALQGSSGPLVQQPASWSPKRWTAPVSSSGDSVDPLELAPEVIQEVLDRCNGVQERAWRELGLASRHVLRRLIQRHGLVLRRTQQNG